MLQRRSESCPCAFGSVLKGDDDHVIHFSVCRVCCIRRTSILWKNYASQVKLRDNIVVIWKLFYYYLLTADVTADKRTDIVEWYLVTVRVFLVCYQFADLLRFCAAASYHFMSLSHHFLSVDVSQNELIFSFSHI